MQGWQRGANIHGPNHHWRLARRKAYLPLLEQHQYDKDNHQTPTILCKKKYSVVLQIDGSAIQSHGLCGKNATTTN